MSSVSTPTAADAGRQTVSERARRVANHGRMPLFYAITAAFLAFLVFALNEPIRFVYLAWTPGYEAFTHRVHHVMLGGLLAVVVLGIAIQLYRPVERVGAFLLSALGIGLLSAVTLIADGLAALAELAIFIVPLAILAVLHPGLRGLRSRYAGAVRDRNDRRMLALGAVAAIPLTAFAAVQVNLHLTVADDHVLFGHYVIMAAGALTIALGALVASFRPTGWRVLAYSVAVLAALVGVASAMFPDPAQGVNFGVVGGALVVLWAIAFVAVAEYGARNADRDGRDGLQGAESDEDDLAAGA